MRYAWLFVAVPVVALCASPRDLASLSKLPVRFEQAGSGSFIGRGLGYDVALTSGGYRISLPRKDGDRLLSVSFPGANRQSRVIAEQPLKFRTNYLKGPRASEWRTGVANYSRVRYESVLPGIDVAYYGNAGQFEFDFMVGKDADSAQVMMQFDGQDGLRVDESGNLRIRMGSEEIVQQLPTVYQKAGESLRLISGEYRLAGHGRVAFELGPYDHSQELVIDPVVLYSGFVSASGSDIAIAIQRDAAGFLYVAGNTRASGLTTTGFPYAESNKGEQDVFIMKITPYATSPNDIVYLSYLGGAGIDEVKAMTMTDPGVLYLTGWTASADFPVTSAAAQSSQKGDRDAFFVKLDINQLGTAGLVYSTFFGGSGQDVANALTLDSAGNAYIAGYSGSTDITMTSDAAQRYSGGGWDAFVVKYTSSGAIAYSTFLGGQSTDIAQAVAVARSGEIIIAGSTRSANLPIAGASYDVNYHDGGGDGFVARIVPNAGLDGFNYGTFFGGDGADEVRQMKFNPSGQLVLVGATASTDFPIGQDAIQTALRGSTDLFVTVLDLDRPQGAALIYSTYLGGSDTEYSYGLDFDNRENVVISGYTLSSNYPVTGGAFQPAIGGSSDAFVTKVDLKAAGAAGLAYSTFLGGPQTEVGYASLTDSTGNLYLVGGTKSRRFPTSTSERSISYVGDYDGYLLVMQPCTVTLSPLSNSVAAAGGDYQLLVTAGPDCAWNVSTSANWIGIKDAGSGQGNGTVVYNVWANDSADPRSGDLFVTNQKHTVTQAGK